MIDTAGKQHQVVVVGSTREAEKVHIFSAFVVAVIGMSTASTSIYFAVQVMVLLAHDRGGRARAGRPRRSEPRARPRIACPLSVTGGQAVKTGPNARTTPCYPT